MEITHPGAAQQMLRLGVHLQMQNPQDQVPQRHSRKRECG